MDPFGWYLLHRSKRVWSRLGKKARKVTGPWGIPIHEGYPSLGVPIRGEAGKCRFFFGKGGEKFLGGGGFFINIKCSEVPDFKVKAGGVC